MAILASSSSSATRQWVYEYDVFLSFRGEETSHGFVSRLYKALCDEGFCTFVDNDRLPRGENILAELLKVIESSMASIIVISENYASSTWCLTELVKIFECEKNGQLVLPVFYGVKPVEIEEKFERDLAKHKAELDDVEMVQRWRAALTKAVNFPGSLYNDGERERDIIMKILEILNGKVIHLEHQPALHRPVHPEEDQPALHRPIMHPEEDQPALHRPTMHPEEDQPVLRRPTMHPGEDYWHPMHAGEDYWHPMHPEGDKPVVLVYGANCASVVGIFSGLRLKGSGFMWDNMGHIVTNWHVIQNASDFRVTLFDRSAYDAKVIGFCKNKDVAVLHAVELERKVKPISIDLFGDLRVGEEVLAIGSRVRGIIDQLVRDGKVLNPHLGITLSSVPLLDEPDWLLVIDVAVDGPAAKAGLRKTDRHARILGDIITSVDGKKVTNSNDMFKILDAYKEGDEVTVEVLRGGGCKKNISVTLELNPDESESDVMLSTRKVFKC